MRHSALNWTRGVVALLAASFTLAVLSLAWMGPSTGTITDGMLATAVVVGAALMLTHSVRNQRRDRIVASIGWTYGAFAAAFCLSAVALFPVIDRGQNLSALALRIHADTRSDRLAVLNPDETTVAMLDRGLLTHFTRLHASATTDRQTVARWFAQRGPSARVLVLLPGHAIGPFTPLLRRLGLWHRPSDGEAGRLQASGAALIRRRYELPQGRRYVLLAPPGSGAGT